MTMLSFRAATDDVAAADRWAAELGLDRSELLRDALRRHLVLLAAENDIAGWTDQPLSGGEQSLVESADWGTNEDWSDWSDGVDASDAAG